ncbi:DUF1971 domain-containing protein [Tepidibacter aestuarii]|uniref:DUF1971 domain-containing protein n=1 Tax=Tepidibacter aestuarii TaxID=2925782 RepID=UPI0020C14F52|nr:DUF1971 domain-containing protein [Tepidibacter aestuarii]CAH2213450.1 DUF1971 domain-containing protein [Tepidibacter aestuarii]
MRYQDKKLPYGAIKVSETPLMNENTVLPGILNKHMSPKEKYGYIVVEKGSLQFVWEDNLEDVIMCDKEHPIVITPERYHHVIITGEVAFKIEFYKVENTKIDISDEEASRPGEKFIQ